MCARSVHRVTAVGLLCPLLVAGSDEKVGRVSLLLDLDVAGSCW